MISAARYERIQAEVRRQEDLERQRKWREQAEREELINKEEKIVRDLQAWVNNWDKAENTRRFVTALEKLWASQGEDVSPDSAKGKRIAWMRQRADRFDPMLPNPPSILDRKSELNRW